MTNTALAELLTYTQEHAGPASNQLNDFVAAYFDNTDPDGFQWTLRAIERAGGLAQTLTVIVSKSGSTPSRWSNSRAVAPQTMRPLPK